LLPIRCAFVTLCTERFVPGALVMISSLRKTGSTAPIVVMHSGDLQETSRRALTSFPHVELRSVPSIQNPHLCEARFADVFTKLNVFALDDFERVVFIDADTLVLQPIDSLFDIDADFAAAPDHGVSLRRGEFNSGVFVCKPNRATFEDMLTKIATVRSRDGGDQGFLNEWFSSWRRLPRSFNTLKRIYWHHPDLFDLGQIKVLHFVGPKPWDQPPVDDAQYRELHDLWWQAYPQDLVPLRRAIVPPSTLSAGLLRALRPLRKRFAPVLRQLDLDGDRAYG